MKSTRSLHTPLLLALFLGVLTLSALSAHAGPPVAGNVDLVGSWRWVSVDGRKTDQPFYVRYYPDGKAATWPAPRGWADAKGVSRGRYSVAGGYLTIDSPSGEHGPKARLQMKKDEFTLTTEDGHKLLYRRLQPVLEPGRMEDGTAGGYLQNPH